MIVSAYSRVYGSTDAFVRFEISRRILDEGVILEAGGEDLAADGVRERDVGAHVETEPEVGPLRGRSCGADRPTKSLAPFLTPLSR